MKRRAAIFSIAALLLITVAITPVFAQMTVEISKTEKTVTVPVVSVTRNATTNMTKTGNATTTAAAGIPGFEAVFAVAGLLAVAYLVMRQRR